MDTVVLFSGGWDSTYCLLRAKEETGTRCAFFASYGQPYVKQESDAVNRIAAHLGVALFTAVVHIESLGDGKFDARNSTLIARMKELYDPNTIYFGSRNVLPWFDRYGDSNWWYARCMAKAFNVDIKTPCVGMRKASIIKHVKAAGVGRFVYSTERGY